VNAPPAARALRGPLSSIEGAAWIVGGGLRDALLGRPVADVDVVVSGDPAAEAARLARAHRAGRFRLSRDFGAWRVQGGALEVQVDVMPLLGGSLVADLARRDFTINALALAVAGDDHIIDMHGGIADLQARRMVLAAPSALDDDPVRVLRLARLSSSLGFSVDPSAREASRRAAARMADAPGERLMEEFARIVGMSDSAGALRSLDDIGGVGGLVPELEDCRGVDQSEYHHLDVLGHTLEVVRNVTSIADSPEDVFRGDAGLVAHRLADPLADGMTRGEALRLTALLHDMAKAATRGVTAEGRVTFRHHDSVGADMADVWLRRMRVSNRLREFVVRGIRHHLDLGFMVHRQPLSLVQYDRYLRRVAPDAVEAIVLSVADRLATDGPRTNESQITRHLALARDVLRAHALIAQREPVGSALDGAALMDVLQRPAGPWVAELLVAIREEALMGRLGGVPETERFALSWADDHPDLR